MYKLLWLNRFSHQMVQAFCMQAFCSENIHPSTIDCFSTLFFVICKPNSFNCISFKLMVYFNWHFYFCKIVSCATDTYQSRWMLFSSSFSSEWNTLKCRMFYQMLILSQDHKVFISFISYTANRHKSIFQLEVSWAWLLAYRTEDRLWQESFIFFFSVCSERE